MGGNTGRGIAGAGGGGQTTTPPISGSSGTTYTQTDFGVVVRDSAFSRATVTYTDGQNGTVTTKEIDNYIRHSGIPADFGGQINVVKRGDRYTININGEGVTMTRSISKDGDGKTYVYNEYFRIATGTKYDQRGFEIFNNQINYLANNTNVSYVQVNAAGWGSNWGNSNYNGFYTWLRFGYKPNANDEANIVASYNRANPNTKVTSSREMMSTQDGQRWWRANGNSWSGQFDLSKGSESRKTLARYVRERAKKNK